MPVTISHNLIVLSQEPEINVLPSGENVTELTSSVCPSKVLISLPVAIFHNFIVLSSEPEINVLSSGEEDIELY